MTTIKKLMIQGVRSFSEKEPQSIEFFSPLTVIVGPNGTGKTTIIEALKFITTGVQPPNAENGKAWVHDPQLSDVVLVKGQIRLLLNDLNRQNHLVIRSFQVTQKKDKREFKALDSSIAHKDEKGQNVSVSKKCVDFDKTVPRLMGVSKAVLENVIFCHQEEANWPLSESRILKEKFDEIFSATRYTKALDHIRKLKQEKVKESKELEAEVRVLDKDLSQFHKLEDNYHSENEIFEKMKQELPIVENKLKIIIEDLKKLESVRDKMKEIQIQIKIFERDTPEKKKMLDESKTQFDTDCEFSDQVLRDYIEQWGQKIDRCENQKDLCKEDIKRLTKEIDAQKSAINQLYRDQGELHAKKPRTRK